MRDRLKDVLTVSLKAGEKRRVATVRLILAAIKDRDIAVRSDGQTDGVSDKEILAILQKMVKQRRESTVLYREGGRLELAAQEEEEIKTTSLSNSNPIRYIKASPTVVL